jgi:hypothetical protein
VTAITGPNRHADGDIVQVPRYGHAHVQAFAKMIDLTRERLKTASPKTQQEILAAAQNNIYRLRRHGMSPIIPSDLRLYLK